MEPIKAVSELSAKKISELIEKVSKYEAFKSWELEKIDSLVRASAFTKAPPNKDIWDYINDNHEMPFSLILKGCLAVLVKGDKGEVINTLLFSEQFFGEFGLLQELRPRSHKLLSLTDVEILIPNQDDIKSLKGKERGYFYEGVAKVLVQKLKDQNYTTTLRSKRDVDDRIAYLLRRFCIIHPWSLVTDKEDEGETLTVSIFWSSLVFNGVLHSEHKTICKNLAKMVKAKYIQVDQHDRDFKFNCTLDEESLIEMSKKKLEDVDHENYIQIKVLNLTNMTSKYHIVD